jgi:hypothetical protein
MAAPRLEGAAVRRWAIRLAVGLAIASGVLGARGLLARPRAPARALLGGAAAAATLHVPHLPGTIVLDGDTDDPGWIRSPGPARTGPFVDAAGVESRPYSEARTVWGDGHLYFSLYAADEDIRSRTSERDGPLWLDDSFRLVFTQPDGERSIEVSPRGVITDARRSPGGAFDYAWESGAHVSPEVDGTVNDARDSDEEWVIEMAIPFEALGMNGERGETIGFSVQRCDTPKGAARVCSAWGAGQGMLRLD